MWIHGLSGCSCINATFHSLIPKREGANSFNLFRPIALYNMVYNIISKLIVERLKPWMNNLISKEHSGFMASRQILDEVVIVTKIMHSMAASKEKVMIIKLNMAKAYD